MLEQYESSFFFVKNTLCIKNNHIMILFVMNDELDVSKLINFRLFLVKIYEKELE